MLDDLLSLIGKVWPYVLALGAAVSWIVQALRSNRKDRSDLIAIAQEAAKGVIQELRAELNRQKGENDELRDRVDHLEGELASVRKTHIAMIEAKDATIAVLNGQVKALNAEVEALRRQMVKAGLTPPPRAEAYFEITAAERLKPATEPLP